MDEINDALLYIYINLSKIIEIENKMLYSLIW